MAGLNEALLSSQGQLHSLFSMPNIHPAEGTSGTRGPPCPPGMTHLPAASSALSTRKQPQGKGQGREPGQASHKQRVAGSWGGRPVSTEPVLVRSAPREQRAPGVCSERGSWLSSLLFSMQREKKNKKERKKEKDSAAYNLLAGCLESVMGPCSPPRALLRDSASREWGLLQWGPPLGMRWFIHLLPACCTAELCAQLETTLVGMGEAAELKCSKC